MFTDKPLPRERPTGIGNAAFNMAYALSNRGVQVFFSCRGHEQKTFSINANLTVSTVKNYSRGITRVALGELRKRDADLVHVHSSAALPALLVSRLFRRPAVVHSHGVGAFHIGRAPIMRKFGLRLSQRVVSVSNSDRDQLIRSYGVAPEKVFVAYNGVRTDIFKPQQQTNATPVAHDLDSFDRILLSIGAVQARKGQILIVKSLPNLLKAFPKLVYVNVGVAYDESYRRQLLELAGALGVDNSIRLLSGLSQEELVELINAASLCVHPAFREGFGLAVVEEMACSKPVVAFHAGPLPEIIDDGKDGLLVKRRNMIDLQETLLRVLADEQLAKRLGEAARAKVLANFTWDKTASSLEKIYADLID